VKGVNVKKLLFVGLFVLFACNSWGAAESGKMKITNNTGRELIFLTNLALYGTDAGINPSLVYLKPRQTGAIDAPKYPSKSSESVIANPMIVVFRDELDCEIDGKRPFHPAVKQMHDRVVGEVDEIASLKDKLLGAPKRNSLPAFRIEKHFAGLPGHHISFERDLLNINPASLVENNAVKVIGRSGKKYQFQLVRLPSSTHRISNFINNSFDQAELLFSNAGNQVRVAPRQTVWFDRSKQPPIIFVNGQEFRPLSVSRDDLKYFSITYQTTPEGDKILGGTIKGRDGEEPLSYVRVEGSTSALSGASSSSSSSQTSLSTEEDITPVRRVRHARRVRFDLPEDFEEKETRQEIAQGKYKPAFSRKKR
jgi:hypothetical protein